MMESTYKLVIYDPVGEEETIQARRSKGTLDTLKGKSVGFLFNQHSSSTLFWGHLEQAVEDLYEPTRLTRGYKPNTWAPATSEMFEKVMESSDYTVIGVGA